MQLGEVLQNVIDEISGLGGDVFDARFIFANSGIPYTYGELTEIMPVEQPVQCRQDWKRKNGETRTWTIDMPMQDHIIVIHAMPEMQIDGDRAILGKHTFHNFDMEWECECGNTMEPDAHICGECRAKNPFLGILI